MLLSLASMVDVVSPRPPQLVEEVMVSGTLPEELAVVLSSRFGVLEEDSGALWTERRSRRLLHALLGRPDSCPDHRPNFERLTLLGVDRDGMVHLIKSLFSVPVGLLRNLP